MNNEKELIQNITIGIHNKKGLNVSIVDLTENDTAPCQYFVICQGTSTQHVGAITRSIGETILKIMGEKPAAVAGLENETWVAMDFGTILVHIFLPEQRDFYDLENLWEDARITKIPNLV